MKIKIGCISSIISLIVSSIIVFFLLKITLPTLPATVPGEDDLGAGVGAMALLFGSVIVGAVVFVFLCILIYTILLVRHKRKKIRIKLLEQSN
jgi:ABC-type antimicrobial peptide transport system permease subunit